MAVKTKGPKDALKSLSWIYVILAALVVILGIILALVPNFNDIAKKYVEVGNPLLYVELLLAFNVLFYLWYFWLARRIADGKSNGTFYMILLLIGVIASIVGFILGKVRGLLTIDFIVSVMALYYVYKIKKESN